MRNRQAYKGLTLVEMTVATLLVVLIISMVYASYTAAARSCGVYTHRLSVTHQAHLALQQTASLIQGCFVPQQASDPNGTLFRAGPRIPYEGLLQVISTRAMVDMPDENAGVFESILRHDRSTRTLLLGQRPWPAVAEVREQAWTWEPLLTGVESIQITVFDGLRWHQEWDVRKNRGLPRALAVHVTVTDDRGTRFEFERMMSLTIDVSERSSKENKSKDDNMGLYEILDI